MKALVVDDSMTMRLMLRHLLQEQGYQVTEACNGAEAMQVLAADPAPDLITLDWNMPVMGGGATLDAIRLNMDYADAKILVISSETDQEKVADALACGTDEYLMKPFSPSALHEKLEILRLSALPSDRS